MAFPHFPNNKKKNSSYPLRNGRKLIPEKVSICQTAKIGIKTTLTERTTTDIKTNAKGTLLLRFVTSVYSLPSTETRPSLTWHDSIPSTDKARFHVTGPWRKEISSQTGLSLTRCDSILNTNVTQFAPAGIKLPATRQKVFFSNKILLYRWP